MFIIYYYPMLLVFIVSLLHVVFNLLGGSLSVPILCIQFLHDMQVHTGIDALHSRISALH